MIEVLGWFSMLVVSVCLYISGENDIKDLKDDYEGE